MKKRPGTKRTAMIAAPVAVCILMLCLAPAQAKTLKSGEVLRAWLAQNPALAASAQDQQNLQCLVATAMSAYTDLAACKNDQACSSEVLYSSVLDAILCINPEADNIDLLACTSDAVASYIEQTGACGSKDKLCQVLNLITLFKGFSGCFGQQQ